MNAFALEIAIAVSVAAALFGVIRFGGGKLAAVAIGVAMLAGIYVANPVHRLYSFHGFWHHAIAFEIANGHVPPHDPLAAGQRLLYPWGMHLVAASLSRLLDVTTATSFALMNTTCLTVASLLLWTIARRLGGDRTASILTVTVPLYGVTPFNFGHLALLVQPLLPVTMEFRGTPPIAQFSHINGGSLGVVFYLWTLDSLIVIFGASEPPSVRRYLGLALAIAGTAFFYPLHFIGAAGVAGAVVAVATLRAAEPRRIVATSIAVAAGVLLVSPYLLAVGAGKDPAGAIRFERDVASLAAELVRYTITASVAVAISIGQRDRLARLFREATEGAVVVVTATAATAALYVLLDYPQNAEYKLQMLSAVSLGILLAPMLASLHERRPLVCFAVVAALCLPLGADVVIKLDPKWWNVTDPAVENGRAIEPADPAERELSAWILANTRPDDAFVDSRMTIPIFAERPLFYPMDVRRATYREWRPNGFLADPRKILLELEGLPTTLVDERRSLARALVVEARTPRDEALAAAEKSLRGDLYVVAREAAAAERLAVDSRFEKVFGNSAATLYRLRATSKASAAP